MTAAPKDKPPREFWLYADFDDTYDTGYSVFTEEQPNITYEIKIHVIEKSAELVLHVWLGIHGQRVQPYTHPMGNIKQDAAVFASNKKERLRNER